MIPNAWIKSCAVSSVRPINEFAQSIHRQFQRPDPAGCLRNTGRRLYLHVSRRSQPAAFPLHSGRAIESGRDLHVSIGTGGVSGDDTATTLAGLAIAEYLADEAAASGIAPTITASDPTSVILAEDAVRRPYTRQGNLSDFPRNAARLPALNPTQYAAATMDLLNHEPVLTNIMSGVFGSDAALIDQAANNHDLPQLFGAADPRALAVMSTSTDNLLLGEEMYAAKAYLRAQLPQLASLRAADIVRVIIAVLIVIVFIIGLLS